MHLHGTMPDDVLVGVDAVDLVEGATGRSMRLAARCGWHLLFQQQYGSSKVCLSTFWGLRAADNSPSPKQRRKSKNAASPEVQRDRLLDNRPGDTLTRLGRFVGSGQVPEHWGPYKEPARSFGGAQRTALKLWQVTITAVELLLGPPGSKQLLSPKQRIHHGGHLAPRKSCLCPFDQAARIIRRPVGACTCVDLRSARLRAGPVA